MNRTMGSLPGRTVATHFQWQATRGLVAAIPLFFCAIASHAETTANRTVIVGLDRDSYLARDMTLLDDQVSEAALAQSIRIGIAGGDGKVTMTISDLTEDAQLPDVIEQHFADRARYTTSRTPAVTIRISYSDSALKTYKTAQLTRDADGLVEYVKTLRTPLPGVSIEAEPGGAVVRSNDPSFADVMTKNLGVAFVVTPVSQTTWHVAWNAEALKTQPPGRQVAFIAETATEVRRYLGDPLDLQCGPTRNGVEIMIPNSELHTRFVENIRQTFGHDPDFVLSEFPAAILNIVQLDAVSQTPEGSMNGPPPGPLSLLRDEIEALINPPVTIAVVGNAVWFSAKDPSRNSDRAAIVRQALSARADLVIDTQPDQSLHISLTPGARLGPPVPSLHPGQLVDAVKARANALKLRPSSVSALDSERVRVTFHLATAAAAFRAALSKPSGVSIRMVDEAGSDSATAPPSPGDEKLSGPNGESFWIKPEAIITSDMFADARASENQSMQVPDIEFRLTDEGRERFAAATRENIGRRFAIILDGKVISAPVIQSTISGGVGEITGNFTLDSANALAQSISPHGDGLQLKVVGP